MLYAAARLGKLPEKSRRVFIKYLALQLAKAVLEPGYCDA
jgi:hypothetical protein